MEQKTELKKELHIKNKEAQMKDSAASPMRVALIGILVENPAAVPQMNEILHEYAPYVIGRMGLPYEKRKLSIISVAVDAPADVISALSGKIGRLEGISTKTIYQTRVV